MQGSPPLHCRPEPCPLLSHYPSLCVPLWAGTRGRWSRGKQVAELEQLPLRLSPGWLAVCPAPDFVQGGGPGWSLPSELWR